MLGIVFALILLFCALVIKNSCFSAENGSCIQFAKLTAIRADSSETGHLISLTRAFFILPLAHFTFDKWQDIYNTVTNAPIYSSNLNKCSLQWLLLLIYARKHHAIPFPFVCLLIRLEQCSIVGLFPRFCVHTCACICTYTLSLFKGNFRNLSICGENQINRNNRKAFSSLWNKAVSSFWKQSIRSTLTAGNSFTSCLK